MQVALKMLIAPIVEMFWPNSELAREIRWDKCIRNAKKAYQEASYDKMDQFLHEGIKTAEQSWGKSSQLAEKIHEIAELYEHWLGKYGQAEALYQRSLSLKEDSLGPDHSELTPTLNNLALLYHQQRRYAEAEGLFKRLLPIVENTLGSDHVEYATSLENYAALLRATDRSEEAARMRARAKEIRGVKSGGVTD